MVKIDFKIKGIYAIGEIDNDIWVTLPCKESELEQSLEALNLCDCDFFIITDFKTSLSDFAMPKTNDIFKINRHLLAVNTLEIERQRLAFALLEYFDGTDINYMDAIDDYELYDNVFNIKDLESFIIKDNQNISLDDIKQLEFCGCYTSYGFLKLRNLS